ncbi:glucose PTS transporter subunit IIA [Dellaglioa sp. L3N]
MIYPKVKKMIVMSAFMPLIVMTGMHWAFAPLFLNASIASPDSLILPAMLAANIAQGAACLAVAIRAKNKNTKQIASAASISALLAGVTEPALYGITLKYKRPLYASMIAGGITGLFMGIMHLKSFAFAVLSIISMPQFVSKTDGQNIYTAVIVLVASFIISFVLTYLFGIDEGEVKVATVTASTNINAEEIKTLESGSKETKKIFSPVSGEVITLESVNDPTFSEKMLGDGIAIIPKNGKIVAPFSGKVVTVFPTKHAIGLKSDAGIELLIHFGLDTVNLKGKPFTQHIEAGQHVKQGELLMEADIKQIQDAGYDITTPVVVTNTAEFVEIVPTEETVVTKDDTILYVI